MVELALNWIDPAALIKAKGLVAEVQPVCEKPEPLVQSIAALYVELRMGI